MAEAERCKFLLEERILLLTHYYKLHAYFETLLAMFTQQFTDSPRPTRGYIYKLHQKFQQIGSVGDVPHSGRLRLH